jgi:YbbR domain-containing protein
MIKGKIHKNSVLLCDKCFDAYKILADLDNYKKGTAKNDMPDAFKDIFGMK